MIVSALLAAGRGRRLGGQKLLLPYAGGMVIDASAAAARADCADAHLAVVSVDSPKGLKDALGREGFEIVINEDPESEMIDSVRLAFRRASEIAEASGQLGVHGLLLFLGDHPETPHDIAAKLVDRFYRLAGQGCAGVIVTPVSGGRRGHPTLFDLSLLAEIEDLPTGVGLNRLLESPPGRVHEVAVSGAGIHQDLDTPEDYRRLDGRDPPATTA